MLLSLSLSLSLYLSIPVPVSLSLPLSLSLSLSLSSLARARSLSLTHSLSISLSHTHAFSLKPQDVFCQQQRGTFTVEDNSNPSLFTVQPQLSQEGVLSFSLAAHATGSAQVNSTPRTLVTTELFRKR